ncbi:hypothetical protein AAFF_G00074540 [Aldrovandia affinis]|uniref:Uncharacterized protein n=1 Tax=Aldrovandia affinis TaxID=143900 RepID=A0AAD7WD01_9TELE|nr:hypothetical protein AAFF_G00074540 [Aldrovandia affinis]
MGLSDWMSRPGSPTRGAVMCRGAPGAFEHAAVSMWRLQRGPGAEVWNIAPSSQSSPCSLLRSVDARCAVAFVLLKTYGDAAPAERARRTSVTTSPDRPPAVSCHLDREALSSPTAECTARRRFSPPQFAVCIRGVSLLIVWIIWGGKVALLRSPRPERRKDAVWPSCARDWAGAQAGPQFTGHTEAVLCPPVRLHCRLLCASSAVKAFYCDNT